MKWSGNYLGRPLLPQGFRKEPWKVEKVGQVEKVLLPAIQKEAVMPDQGSGITININPELAKDLVVLAGVGLDGLNYLSPHIPPGVSSMVGLALRAIINLFSRGKTA
jgi:hypothetical protein